MSEDRKTPEETRRPIFSDTVDQLARTEPPDDATLRELLQALRAVLVIELKRRGVWQAPPSFLRVLGESWLANDGEALTELTQDAYLYIFAQRLAALIKVRWRGQDAAPPVPHDVGPLVLKMVRQFITHRQRLADPLGYSVYSRIHEAMLRLVGTAQLHVAGAGERIHNRTLLSFEAYDENEDVTPTDAETLADLVVPWNGALMPELVTALGKAVIPLIDDLRQRVLSLQVAGIEAFSFGDLVAPLKRDARRRWNVVRGEAGRELGFEESEEGEGYEAVPIAWPHNPVEYESLLDCVNSSIGRHDPSREQGSLWYLWLLARGVHRGGDEPRQVSVAGTAKLLEVSRRQVGKLLKALQGMVSTCLSAFAPSHRSTEHATQAATGEPTHDRDDTAPRAESLSLRRRP